MAAPTVTRPAAVIDDPKSGQGSGPAIDWARYARWFVVGAAVVGLGALVYSLLLSHSVTSRREAMSKKWDEYHRALDKKDTEEDQIAALESLCENPAVKGSAAHGTALMELAHHHLEMAQNPKKQPEARAASIDRAAKIYEMVATTEPFKSNPSYGPEALSNWATTYEQQQINQGSTTESLDKAIKTLQLGLYTSESKEADPIGTMKTHFLFDKLNAQLGKMYWVRAQFKEEAVRSAALENVPVVLMPIALNSVKTENGKADREMAQFYLKRALDAGVPAVERDHFDMMNTKAPWRKDAAYLKALLDPPGKMLPDGVPPPVKPEARAEDKKDKKEGDKKDGDKKEGAKAPDNKEAPDANAKPADTKTPDQAKAADTKAPDAKAPETKAPEKKEPEKKEPEKKDAKPGNASADPIGDDAVAASPTQHLSFAQIQAMLKQGKTTFCQCPRCAPADKAIGAKLVE